MDLEPFKNKDSSVYKKKKNGFIQARIKLAIYNKIKRVGALPRIATYIDFERVVLNTKDVVRNQTSSSKKLRVAKSIGTLVVIKGRPSL